MWTIAGLCLIALGGMIGAYFVGKKYGQTKQRKDDAEAQAEDMAHNAEIASKPPVDHPFRGMHD